MFKCKKCVAEFNCQKLLDAHIRNEHQDFITVKSVMMDKSILYNF